MEQELRTKAQHNAKMCNVNNRQVAAISGTISECWRVFNSLKSVSDEQSITNKLNIISPYLHAN